MALDEVAIVFGILVAETILASVHVRAHEQAAACGKRTLMRAGRRPPSRLPYQLMRYAEIASIQRNAPKAHQRSSPSRPIAGSFSAGTVAVQGRRSGIGGKSLRGRSFCHRSLQDSARKSTIELASPLHASIEMR
jgi:hypothetical protein